MNNDQENFQLNFNQPLAENLDFVYFTPPHKCKQHLIILVQEHSVNSLHNIVIIKKVNVKSAGKYLKNLIQGE